MSQRVAVLQNRLRKLDLQDMSIFIDLLHSGHAGQTADRLSLSASSVSYSLKRLREVFSDPLFIRQGNQVIATARAKEAEPYLRSALAAMEQALTLTESDLEPELWDFQLCIPEMIELTLLPALLQQLQQQRPGSQINTERLTAEPPFARLLAGTLDLLVVPGPGYFELHPNLNFEAVLEDEFVCLARGNQPRELTLDAYCEALHVYPSPWLARDNMIDRWLASMRRKRRVVARASGYQSCLNMLENSGVMLMLPKRMLPWLRIPQGVQMHRPPAGCPKFTCDLVWSPQLVNTARGRWLQRTASELVKTQLQPLSNTDEA